MTHTKKNSKNSKDRVYYRLRTHLEMLQDRMRCLAYQQALTAVARDKVVLDIGCGSGILSLFAAKAGARRVLAVDMDIPPGAEEVARANGLANKIQFFKGKIQEIDLPVDSVDIIVSEWMGGLLLMEDMLPAVLYARDTWLKPDGLLLPDQARLFLAPLGDVAGISSQQFPSLRETISTQMWVSVLDRKHFLAEPANLLDLDLYLTRESEAKSYERAFSCFFEKAGTFNGFGLWFDVVFNIADPPPILSTAPWQPPTHWAQALWILPTDIDVTTGDEVIGTFSQTNITPAAASFKADFIVRGSTRGKTSISQIIEASPSNMNTPGANENQIAEQAAAGAYQGLDCLWIGCSMSFGALMAARNGAKSVSILNHSPWAAKAMQQLAQQQGLVNTRFLNEVPVSQLRQHKDTCLLGTVDGSWQALLSHIKGHRALDRASYRLQLSWQESPWEYFYGFDFSPYAPYDLEMVHEDQALTEGLLLKDITPQVTDSATPPPDTKEIIFSGICEPEPSNPGLNWPDRSYNCAKVDFTCGSVALPLPGTLSIDSSKGEPLQKAVLTISVLKQDICRFELLLVTPGQSFRQCYEKPLASLGHIIQP